MSDNNLVNLTIDGQAISVPAGTLLVDAAKRISIDVPVFCYHPKLPQVGMCRMCLVEVASPRPNRETGELELVKFPTLQTACTMEVSEGMVVDTQNSTVIEARDDVLEFLLTSHPLDCPVCDKGGECPLQNLTMAHGPGESRFVFEEKMDLAKHVPLGDLIYLDRERCIQCARCTRFSDDIADDHVIGFFQRGRQLQIVSLSEPGFDSYFSGNTTDICPVGALTTADFRFGARPWEMTQVATICTHCPVGCNMSFSTRLEARSGGDVVVKRVMPRQNEQVNEIWICDKGRFGHHFTNSPKRLTRPLMQKGGKLVEVDWDEAVATIVAKLKTVDGNVAGLAGPRLSNEDYFTFQKFIRALGSNHLDVFPAEMNAADIVAQVGVGQGTNLAQLGAGDVILAVATDLEEEAPIWWLRVKQATDRGATLILVGGRHTKLDRYAAITLNTNYGEEAAAVLGLLAEASGKGQPGREVDGLKEAIKQAKNFKADAIGKAAAQAILDANNVVAVVGSEGLNRDGSRALLQAVANLLLATGHAGRPNNGLIPVWPGANLQGAFDMGLSASWGPGYAVLDAPGLEYAPMLAALKKGDIQALYMAGADPAATDAAAYDAIKSAGFVVVQDMFLTETAQLADVVLPVQSVAEREGTFTNGERRVQRTYPAIAPVGKSKADWQIFNLLGHELDLDLHTSSAAGIMLDVIAAVPQYDGFTYQALSETVYQWPDVGGEDLYYGGNAFQNTRGLGLQWATLADNPEATLYVVTVEPADAPVMQEHQNVIAVPTRTLYDREIVFAQSEVVHGRVPAPYVALHPADAGNLGLGEGNNVALEANGYTIQATVRIIAGEGGAPEGVVLLPANLQPGVMPRHAMGATLRKVTG